MRPAACLVVALAATLSVPAHARTVYRCTRNGTISLSTAPEPGSKCVAKHFEDDPAKVPNLWGNLGVVKGTLYERQQDGKTVYGGNAVYGADQDCVHMRARHLRRALQVSASCDGDVLLLVPAVRFGDEWEAWFLGAKNPGAFRFKSFRALMDQHVLAEQE